MMPYEIESKYADNWVIVEKNIRDMRKAKRRLSVMNSCLFPFRIVYVSPDESTREVVE